MFSCKFKIADTNGVQLSFGTFQNGDSVKSTEFLSQPILTVLPESLGCKILDFTIGNACRGCDYQLIENEGSKLTQQSAKYLANCRRGDRIDIYAIKAKCNDSLRVKKESLLFIIK